MYVCMYALIYELLYEFYYELHYEKSLGFFTLEGRSQIVVTIQRLPAPQCLKYFSLYIKSLPTFNLDYL